MAKITFYPEAWQNDYAISVDPEGPTEFEVPDTDVSGLQDDTYESDELRNHPNAPAWIREWRGPFYVSIQQAGER